MKGDNPVLLDMGPTETGEVTVTRKPSTNSDCWKRIGALLTITLCFAAAIFFTFHSKEHYHAAEADDAGLRHTLRQISGTARAAIHLEGEYNKNLEKLEWKQGVDQYHAEGGLKLIHNEIEIPRDGLYFVYSQASFRVNCHPDQRLDDEDIDDDDEDIGSAARRMVHVSHAVKLWSHSYGNTLEDKNYETILHSVRTGCEKKVSENPEADDKWYGSVYMGAVFNLHKGDRLKTPMDKKFLPLLNEKSGNTFFGVFAL